MMMILLMTMMMGGRRRKQKGWRGETEGKTILHRREEKRRHGEN